MLPLAYAEPFLAPHCGSPAPLECCSPLPRRPLSMRDPSLVGCLLATSLSVRRESWRKPLSQAVLRLVVVDNDWSGGGESLTIDNWSTRFLDSTCGLAVSFDSVLSVRLGSTRAAAGREMLPLLAHRRRFPAIARGPTNEREANRAHIDPGGERGAVGKEVAGRRRHVGTASAPQRAKGVSG